MEEEDAIILVVLAAQLHLVLIYLLMVELVEVVKVEEMEEVVVVGNVEVEMVINLVEEAEALEEEMAELGVEAVEEAMVEVVVLMAEEEVVAQDQLDPLEGLVVHMGVLEDEEEKIRKMV